MSYIVIMAATKIEMKHFLKEDVSSLCPLIPSRLSHKNKDIIVLLCGIGPINAAIACGHLFPLRDKISGIINIGIAGSFDLSTCPIGSIFAVTKEIWPEYGLRTEGSVDPTGINYGLMRFSTGEIIYNQIEIDPYGACTKMGLSFKDKLVTGSSLTVAGVTGTPSLAQKIYRQYRAKIENMEGFSIAYWCKIYNIPFLELRTISNPVGIRDIKEWNIKGALASLGKIKSILGI